MLIHRKQVYKILHPWINEVLPSPSRYMGSSDVRNGSSNSAVKNAAEKVQDGLKLLGMTEQTGKVGCVRGQAESETVAK
eukprot:768689-Hanusia_phi.AAC.7